MRSRLVAIAFLLTLVPVLANAFSARVILPDGTPAAQARVSIAGRPGSILTDSEGRVRIFPGPALPITIVVTASNGELYPPVVLEDAAAGDVLVRLERAYRESITVVPGIAPTLESAPAAAAVSVTSESIEQRQPDRLIETIAAIPGVSGGGMGSTSVPAIRGLSRGRTVVLVDESRVATERRAGASATFLNPFGFSSVEVARGPGSVAYGSDAFGGVILVRERVPVVGESSVRYELGQSAGATSTRRAGLELTYSRDRSAILLSIHGRDGDDTHAGGGDLIRDSSFRDFGGALRFLHNTSAGAVRAGYSHNNGRDIGKPEATSSITSTIYPIETSDRLSLGWDSGPLHGWTGIEVDAYAGHNRLVLERNRLTAFLVERSDVAANDASLRVVATRPVGGARIQAGGEFLSRFGLKSIGERRQFDASGTLLSRFVEESVEDAERFDAGAFVLADQAIGSRLLISAGGRVDQIRSTNRGGYFGDRSTTNSAVSGHLAATLTVARATTATVQVARGFRDPTLSDRYFRGVSGRGFVTGSPDLRSETSAQFDAALRWHSGRRSLSLYGYNYRIQDLIERYRAGNDFFFRNRGRSYVRGLELEGEYGFTDLLTMEIGAAAARGGIIGTDETVDDVAAPGGHVGLSWAAARTFATVRFSAFTRHDRTGPTEIVVPGYSTLDASAGYRFSDILELRIHASNLTDRRYVGAADEIAPLSPGRAISIAVSGKLAR